MSGSPTYRSWEAMRRRCLSSKSDRFAYYGGRGIKICSRWNSFENFLDDMGLRPEGCTLDRIDNSGHYTPKNCRWATRFKQARNTRQNIRITHNGQTLTLMEWEPIVGIPRDTLYQRYRRDGDRPPKLFRPVKQQYNNRKITRHH